MRSRVFDLQLVGEVDRRIAYAASVDPPRNAPQRVAAPDDDGAACGLQLWRQHFVDASRRRRGQVAGLRTLRHPSPARPAVLFRRPAVHRRQVLAQQEEPRLRELRRPPWAKRVQLVQPARWQALRSAAINSRPGQRAARLRACASAAPGSLRPQQELRGAGTSATAAGASAATVGGSMAGWDAAPDASAAAAFPGGCLCRRSDALAASDT